MDTDESNVEVFHQVMFTSNRHRKSKPSSQHSVHLQRKQLLADILLRNESLDKLLDFRAKNRSGYEKSDGYVGRLDMNNLSKEISHLHSFLLSKYVPMVKYAVHQLNQKHGVTRNDLTLVVGQEGLSHFQGDIPLMKEYYLRFPDIVNEFEPSSSLMMLFNDLILSTK
jgi:hypothetical protein